MIRMTTTVVAVASVLFAARADPYRVTVGEDWVPVDFRKGVEAGSALDFSCFGLADAPAGKHGWLEVRGGHFVFPDSPDVPRRFYGPNVVFDGCCPVGDDAAMLAERILRMGYNSVRLHQADRALIAGDNGEEVDRREYAPEKIDRLDRFCAECFKRGIYVTTDLYCSRNVLWGDVSERMGHDPGEPLDYHMFKAMIMFDDRAYAEWREAARKFLAHRNPYTGRTYAEEPGMPFVSLVNETNLAKNWATLKDIPLVRAAWKECFGSDDVASSKETTAFGDFEAWLEERFFVKAKRFLREELGVRALLTNQNIGQNRPTLQRVREKLYDYNDGHTYEAHPRRRRGAVGTCSDNDPTAVEWMGGAARANAAIAGKPTVCSEWDYSCPARYRSCAGLLMGTLMSQQDFSAAWRYGWICSLGNRCDELKDGCVFPARPFSGLTDPVGLATDRMAALLFLRGDAPVMSGPGVCLRLTDSAFVREDCIIPRSDKAFPFGGVWKCRFAQAIAAPVPSGWREMRFEDGEAAKSSSIPYPLSRDPSAVLNRNPAAKTLTVSTPRSCGGFAFPSSGIVEVGPLAFRLGRSHATVYAASVDSGPTTLSLSNRILVMHLTCLQSEGSEFEDDSFRVWLKNGNVPVVADGDARISLRLERPSEYRVWVLDTAGARKEVVPCVADGSALSFAAHVRGSDGKARLYYEVTRVEGEM